MGRTITDGRGTKIWSELWSPLDLPLLQYIDKNWQLLNLEDTVHHYLLDDRRWNDSKLRMFLLEWVIHKIHMVQPQENSLGDKLCWRPSSDGNFTVKSAYECSKQIDASHRHTDWKKIWASGAPERAKFFMWQVFQEKVPTNSWRAHICEGVRSECPFECHSEETLLHTLRDCETVKDVWLFLIKPSAVILFFSLNLQDWIRWCLHHNPASKRASRWPWFKLFCLVCWHMWKS